ncbi:hypothetical protein MKX03_017809 [Papaver bracteatum]|nr:hypothetical protein MKX03_017809 [Papaver bracteatum]
MFKERMFYQLDQLRSLASKWQTLIEAHNDVKTTDNFTLRMLFVARWLKSWLPGLFK